MKDLLRYLSMVTDNRQEKKVLHKMDDIIAARAFDKVRQQGVYLAGRGQDRGCAAALAAFLGGDIEKRRHFRQRPDALRLLA